MLGLFRKFKDGLAKTVAAIAQKTRGLFGGRKIDAWTALHRCASVPFDQIGDSPQAFANANTLAELQQLESI